MSDLQTTDHKSHPAKPACPGKSHHWNLGNIGGIRPSDDALRIAEQVELYTLAAADISWLPPRYCVH